MFEQDPTAEYTVISLSDRPPPAADRREGQRHLTVLQAGKIVSDRGQELCLIRNISSRGMMAEVYSDFAPEDRIGIEFKAGTAVRGTVRWVDGDRAGIEFDESIDVHRVLAPHGAALAPRSPRLSIDGTARVKRGEDDEELVLPVVDISQGGMKVRHAGQLEEDLEILVVIEGLPVRAAIVRWCEEQTAGVSFTRTMPLDRIAYWAARQRPGNRDVADAA